MTTKLKPGRSLSDAEAEDLADLLARNYPNEDFEIILDDSPRAAAIPAPYIEPEPRRNPLQNLFVVVIMGIAGLYLINPTAGVIEVIPDVIPIIGNLDEAAAVALLISGLSYFGVNVGWLTAIFGRGLPKRKREP